MSTQKKSQVTKWNFLRLYGQRINETNKLRTYITDINLWDIIYNICTRYVTPLSKFIIGLYVEHEPNSFYDRGLFWSFSFSVRFQFASVWAVYNPMSETILIYGSRIWFHGYREIGYFWNLESILLVGPLILLLDFDGCRDWTFVISMFKQFPAS